MRWPLLVVLVAAGGCRPQSAPPSRSPPSPARVAQLPPPAPVLAVEPPLETELPWVDPDEPRIGGIVGLVLDEQSEPIPGAVLIASAEGSESITAITNEEGAYFLEDLAPDDYLITLYYIDQTEEHHVTVGDEFVELSLTITYEPHPVTISFGCGTSLENTYVVDGIDTTGLTFDE